jgi:outer membrane cobalamin receptor
MRSFGAAFFLLLSLGVSAGIASATDLKVKVVDPQSAPVPGAQVTLSGATGSPANRILATSSEGVALFSNLQAKDLSSGKYRIEVLAPGFARSSDNIDSSHDTITVKLHLAVESQTVVVTATRTPDVAEQTGSSISTLESEQLETMQPIASDDAVRFLPGAVINSAGQRGGLSSLFVRGGDSTYNKVIVDGVTINEPGGTFDFGTLPLTEANRVEFLRGAQSTLYGTDAMTSVVQVFTRSGSTPVPEFRFGADGGNFATAHGFASLAGAEGRIDYNVFGNQFITDGSGVNDGYSDSLQGANFGARLNDDISLRFHLRHSNSHTGVPGEWSFNGYDPIVNVNGVNLPLPPDPAEWSQLNSLLGSAEVSIAAPSGWQHRFTGFDYLYRYTDLNLNGDADRVSPLYGQFDFPYHEYDDINRGGFEYQADYSERPWAHTTLGYRIENENGFVGSFGSQTHGQRLEHDLYLQQQLTWGRLSAVAGGRFIHNSAFGNTGVPRVALTFLALHGGEIFSGTRLRFSYATGFKEPRLEETFAGPPYSAPNPGLLPERVRAFEAGIQQNFIRGRYIFNATYFNNLFHNQINYETINPSTFVGEYFNVNRAFAQGTEVELQAKLRSRLLLDTTYTYTSTQILDNPAPIDSQYYVGQPLLRRPKHSANLLLSYLGNRWGGNLGGSFVGRRPDDDFYGFNINHAAGYVRADLGGWRAINSRITAYASVQNALDRRYNEVVGYPALPINFRAGFRFRVGGE